MALTSSFVWKNPDSTLALNDRLRRIVGRGIVWGGAATPGSGLNITINPLIAVSFDGQAFAESVIQTIPLLAGQKSYVVIRVKYNIGAAATVTWQVLKDSVYAVDAEKDYLVVVCTVTLAPGAVAVALANIDFTERDEVDPLGRSWYRGHLANVVDLPVPTSPTNRIGDFYFVHADRTMWFWNLVGGVGVWEPLNDTVYDIQTVVMNAGIISAQRDRNANGSGILCGARPTDGSLASPTDINVLEQARVQDKLHLDSFTALVNGHYIEVHGQRVQLQAQPAVGTRYDLVVMEVWREDNVIPDLHTYATTGSAPYTLDEVDNKLATLAWKKGWNAFFTPGTDNFDIDELGSSQGHRTSVVHYRFFTMESVPTTALYNTTDPALSGAALNIDGVAFTSDPAGSGADDRIWVSSGSTPMDGVSWAMPLFCIKRTDTEYLKATPISIFDSRGTRLIFPVYPTCDTDNNARQVVETVRNLDPHAFKDATKQSYDKQSGFITGMDFQIQDSYAGIAILNERAKVRVRGYEDWLPGSLTNVPLGTPPTGAAGDEWARILVYLKMSITLYGDDTVNKYNYYISDTNRPIIPSNTVAWPLGPLKGLGMKRGVVQYEVMAENLGNVTVLDENDSMLLSGWTKGDDLAVSQHQYDDGGLWCKTVAIDVDDRIHPYLREWAIPICLVHRRNSAAWHHETNPNGTGVTRPDDRKSTVNTSILDLVDLRHQVDTDQHAVKQIIDSSIDKIMKGQLRTRMANKMYGAGQSGEVAGSAILQSDSIGAVTGCFQLTAPDGSRTIWSDAKEFIPVSCSFDLLAGAPISEDLYEYTYTSGSQYGTLIIKAPPGAHIVRHLPALMYAASSADQYNMEFFGPPCWTTQFADWDGTVNYPMPAHAKFIDNDCLPQNLQFRNIEGVPPAYTVGATVLDDVEPFFVSATDTFGRATEMTGYIDTAIPESNLGTAVLSWWVHYDRKLAEAPYTDNYGLAEIPDTVWSATLTQAGLDSNLSIGCPYVIVRKSFLLGATSLVITDANVAASMPSTFTGAVSIIGYDWSHVTYYMAGIPPTSDWNNITLNNAQDTLTIAFESPTLAAGVAEVIVFYQTSDVSRWIEVGRGGKSIRALYGWSINYILDLTASPPVTYGLNLNACTWTQAEVGGATTNCFPIIWHRATTPAGDWTLASAETSPGVNGGRGFENSNLIQFNTSGIGTSRYVKVYAPHIIPLPITAPPITLRIDYTYTPYQGHYNGGVLTATIKDEIKKQLHGTIVGNSDFYATQSGPCSVHSGVETWSGYSINYPPAQLYDHFTIPMRRFAEYNATELVKPYPKTGMLEANWVQNALPMINAAAVLRLPFPQHTSMYKTFPISTFGPPNVDLGVMEYDLDPCRAGASSGTYSYAPGYTHNGVAYGTNNANLIRYNQFVNGLSALATGQGGPLLSRVITPDMYNTSGSGSTHTNTFIVTPNWADASEYGWCIAGGAVTLCSSLDSFSKGVLASTLTYTSASLSGATGTSGIVALLPRLHTYAEFSNNTFMWWWAAIGWLGAVRQGPNITYTSYDPTYNYFCTAIGFLQMLTNAEYPNASVILQLSPNSTMGFKYVFETQALVEPFPIKNQQVEPYNTSANYGTRYSACRSSRIVYNDTIRVPFGYGAVVSSVPPTPTSIDGSTHQLSEFPTLRNSSILDYGELTGLEIEYPASWTPGDITLADSLIVAPVNGGPGSHYGRGVYIGTTSSRYVAPTLVPGSGTNLMQILLDIGATMVGGVTTPPSMPYMPKTNLFVEDNRLFHYGDHGGPLAYVFYGTGINPQNGDYRNRLILQITGGPNGMQVQKPKWDAPWYMNATAVEVTSHAPQDLSGSALDAFYPIGRPLLSKR